MKYCITALHCNAPYTKEVSNKMACSFTDNALRPNLWLYDISRGHADLPENAPSMKMREVSILMRRKILAGLLERTLGTLEFHNNENGKPNLKNNCGLNFSVSHTGTLWGMAVVLNNVQIGFDVEQARSRKYMDEIMEAYFHHEERHYYSNLQGEQSRIAYFYKLWTQKEAYAKYLGLGLNYNFACECFNEGYPDDLKIVSGRVTEHAPRAHDIYLSLVSSLDFKSQDWVLKGDQSLNVNFIAPLEQ